MSDTAIVRIPIDDAAFQKFLATFNAYQKDLGNQGKAWAQGTAGIQSFGQQGAATFSSMAEGLAAVTAALAAVAMRQNEAENSSRRTNNTLRDTLRLTGGILSNVTGVALQLTRWALLGGLSGLATGMLGAGALASGASSLRSQSRYLGVRPGQLQAAQTVFGPMGVDADQLLGSIANFQLSNPAWAQMLGIGPNVNPGDALPQVLRGAVNTFRAGGPFAGAAMLEQRYPFLDPGLVRQLSRLPSGELEQAFQRYGQQSNQLDIPDATLKNWQRLDETLRDSEKEIRKALIDGLAPLTPQLKQLSSAIVGFVGQALGATGAYLTTPDDVKEQILRDTPGGKFLFGIGDKIGDMELWWQENISHHPAFDWKNMSREAYARKYGWQLGGAAGAVPRPGVGTVPAGLIPRGSDPLTWTYNGLPATNMSTNLRQIYTSPNTVRIDIHQKPGTDVTTQVNQLPGN